MAGKRERLPCTFNHTCHALCNWRLKFLNTQAESVHITNIILNLKKWGGGGPTFPIGKGSETRSLDKGNGLPDVWRRQMCAEIFGLSLKKILKFLVFFEENMKTAVFYKLKENSKLKVFNEGSENNRRCYILHRPNWDSWQNWKIFSKGKGHFPRRGWPLLLCGATLNRHFDCTTYQVNWWTNIGTVPWEFLVKLPKNPVLDMIW